MNTYVTGSQYFSAAAIDRAGNFVVVWRGTQTNVGDIFAQRFDAAGTPTGAEFRVNSNVGGPQGYPVVTPTTSGEFVVVWDGPEYYGLGVKAAPRRPWQHRGAGVPGEQPPHEPSVLGVCLRRC